MKTELMLLLYDALLEGQNVRRVNFCRKHDISQRTFYRYIRELTDFFRRHKPDCVIGISDDGGEYFLNKVL